MLIWPWRELKRLRAENERLERSLTHIRSNLTHIRSNYDFWRANWLSRTQDLYAAQKGIKRLRKKLAKQHNHKGEGISGQSLMGEFICRKCGLRKNSEFGRGEF